MTQAQKPLEQEDYQVVAPGVRVLPPHPLGGDRNPVDALQLAELGAMLGADGAERGAMTALLHEIQSIAVQTSIGHLPQLRHKFREWERAKLNRLLQQVRGLPEATPPQGVIGRIMNGPQVPLRSYVDRQEVMKLIAMAMVEQPVV